MLVRKTLVIAAVLAITSSTAFAAGIECSKIGVAFDALFVDGNTRVEAILKEYKALPASTGEPQREGIRKKFCAVGGEIVGLYKIVRALANECAKLGQPVPNILDVVDKQLGLAQEGVKICQ